MIPPDVLAAWLVVAFFAAVGAAILYEVLTGKIDLSGLLSEPPEPGSPPGSEGKASLSRLQLLLFTFAIVGLYLTLSLKQGKLADLPPEVLGLLGISGGSYIISKGIQMNAAPAAGQPNPNPVAGAGGTVNPATAAVVNP